MIRNWGTAFFHGARLSCTSAPDITTFIQNLQALVQSQPQNHVLIFPINHSIKLPHKFPPTMTSPSPPQTTPLFTLPIPISSPLQSHPGSLICSTPSPLHPTLYLLTFTSPPDNRLTTTFCQTLLLALDILEFSHPVGAICLTSGIGKFFSNGLDLNHATETEGFWESSLYALWKRLLTCISLAIFPSKLFLLPRTNNLTNFQLPHAHHIPHSRTRFRWRHHDSNVHGLPNLQPFPGVSLSQRA